METDPAINRRLFLALLQCFPAGIVSTQQAFAATKPNPDQPVEYGPAAPFSFELLRERARELAASPHVPRPTPANRITREIDFDAHNKIYQPVDHGPFPASDGEGAVTLLHLGRLFPHPVRIHVLANGVAREVRYEKRYFRYPKDSPAAKMPANAGFAGFRLHRRGDPRGLAAGRAPDWMSFLGASYFRSSGDGDQYGLSARGLAIDTAVPGRTEEFPAFTSFWIEKRGEAFLVYALLESKSATGAYSFEIRRYPKVVTTVRATIFPRRDDIACLGVAPLTSMYWYSETNRWIGKDWRPEVHDSDGLLIQHGSGEWIWRPLNNPPRLSVSAFQVGRPRGFGLLQRDRSPTSYVDPVAFERRPNLWVEPLGGWPEGEVHLVEIPTDSEYFDNIVAYFKPANLLRPGESLDLSYRLHWNVERILPEGFAPAVAMRTTKTRTVAVRVAEAEPVVNARSRARTVMIEFKGAALGRWGLPQLEPVIEGAMAGHEIALVNDPDGNPDHLRLLFNVDGQEDAPSEIRAFLRGPEGPVTATVLAQVWLQ